MRIGKLSQSSMNRYYNCQRSWWYNYQGREGIEIDSTARDLGINLHDIINDYYKALPGELTEDIIKDTVWRVFNKEFDTSLNYVKREAERCIKNFLKFEIKRFRTWDVYTPTFTEEKLVNDKYVTIVDFHSDPEGVTIDWKTGNMTQLYDNHHRQVKIEQTVLRDNGHRSDKFLFVALKTGKVIEAPSITRAWLEKQRLEMIGGIKRGEFERQEGPLCDYCPYQLDCEFGDICLWMLI